MAYNRRLVSMVVFLIAVAVIAAQAGEKNAPPTQKIPKGAKVFVAPISQARLRLRKRALPKK